MIWKNIPLVPVKQLIDARLQLHHAIQIVAIMARSFIGTHPEDIHANLKWKGELGALVSNSIACHAEKIEIGLVLEKPTLIVNKNHQVQSFSLIDKTWQEAFDWMTKQLSDQGLNPEQIEIMQPYGHDLPTFLTVGDRPFDFANPDAYRTLAYFYSNTQNILTDLLKEVRSACEIRCWPHHFDLASLIQLEESKSVGIGLSPGDKTYHEPYYYVSPWPYPNTEKKDLPVLKSGGTWHTQGWLGAVLLSSEILEAEDQANKASSFLKETLGYSLDLLNGREVIW